MNPILLFLHILLAVLAQQPGGSPKRLTLQDLMKTFEKDATVTLEKSGVTISSFNCRADKKFVEAITFRPRGEGPFPGILLVPGYMRSARDDIPLGFILAGKGFASVAVSQQGFGRSGGKPDWVGPGTMKALAAVLDRFEKEPWVDEKRLGVFGYSRGATASALLAVTRKDLKAAVCAAGVYDLKKAFETSPIEGIRKNIEIETGLSEEAFEARSPLFMMENLRCPLLILHGEEDANAPVEQAKGLRDKLALLKKDFEVRIFPGREHDIGYENLVSAITGFFTRRLKEKAATGKEESGSPGNTGDSERPGAPSGSGASRPPGKPVSPGVSKSSRPQWGRPAPASSPGGLTSTRLPGGPHR